MIDDYSGLQKAAILLITLGPEKASAIFQHLKEDEIESLTLEIANTRSVSPQDKESVLDEYYQVCLAQQYIAEGGIGYAKELLEKLLAVKRLRELFPSLQHHYRSDHLSLSERLSLHSCLIYTGRASSDNSHDSFLSVVFTGCHDTRCFASGKAG